VILLRRFQHGRQLNPGSTIATCGSLGMALVVSHHKVLKVQRLHQDCHGSFIGSIAHAAIFPTREAADTWLQDRRSEDSVYMLERPCSGSTRHLILSKRALAQAEVSTVTSTMDQALLSHEWRPHFAEYGPVIFNALKSDQRPQRARGKAGAARVAATLSWEEVIARVDPIRFGSSLKHSHWRRNGCDRAREDTACLRHSVLLDLLGAIPPSGSKTA
jgi:hypothetical protein